MRFLLQALVSARPHSELQILQEFWRMVLYNRDPKVANLAEKCADTAHICTEICTKQSESAAKELHLNQARFKFWV